MNKKNKWESELIEQSKRETPDYWEGINSRIALTPQIDAEPGMRYKQVLNILRFAVPAAALIAVIAVIMIFGLPALFHGNPPVAANTPGDRIVMNVIENGELFGGYTIMKMPFEFIAGEYWAVSRIDETLNGAWKEKFSKGALPEIFPDYIVWAQYLPNLYVELGSDKNRGDPKKGFEIWINGAVNTREGRGLYDAFRARNLTKSNIGEITVTFAMEKDINSSRDNESHMASYVYDGREYLVTDYGDITETEFIDFILSILK